MIGSSPPTFFLSMALTHQLLHHSSGSRSSPDIYFAPFSCPLLLLGDTSELGLSSPTNCTNYRSFSALLPQHTTLFHFQKAHWDDSVFYFDFYCPTAEESYFLFSAAALFGTECSQILYYSWPRQTNLKPGGLKRKKWLVKHIRLLLPLTKVLKIASSISTSHHFHRQG